MKYLKFPVILMLLLFTLVSCQEDPTAVSPDENTLSDGINDLRSGYYTPKPKGLPSKAPKSVICRYARQNGISSIIWGYCGGGTPSAGGPAPQSVLDALWSSQLTHNVNNLYILAPNHPNGEIPFTSLYSYYFPQINNHITAYYQQIFIPQLGYTLTITSNITQPKHVNKQAFIDSWYNWVFDIQSSAPSTFSYFIANPSVYYQIFNFFADYNKLYDESEGIYLGVPYGQYAPNQDMRCVTSAAQYLSTSAGLTLIQQLNTGAITLEQFRTALPNCS